MSQKPPDQMSLIFFAETRHIMAAATRNAVPSTAASTGSETDDEKKKNAASELATLVGTKLLIRDCPINFYTVGAGPGFAPTIAATPPIDFINSGFEVPVTDLDIITADFKQNIFIKSRQYFVAADKTPQLNFDPATTVVHATRTDVTVELSTAVSEKTSVAVLVYVKNGPNIAPIPLTGKIDPANKKCVMSVQLTTNTYQLLTFVQSFTPSVYEQAVP